MKILIPKEVKILHSSWIPIKGPHTKDKHLQSGMTFYKQVKWIFIASYKKMNSGQKRINHGQTGTYKNTS